jgi:hypothetical protein
VSVRIAREFLEQQKYPEDKIKLVEGCITATRLPQRPHNALEEILCDADMSNAGRGSYLERLDLLRIEVERATERIFTDEEWDKENLDALAGHKYFTRFAQQSYDRQKQEHIRQLDKRIRKRSRLEKPKNEVVVSTLPTSQPERSTEAILNLLTRKHLTLSAHADHKAQTLIVTNALIIALVVGLVITELAENPNLAIPGFTLMAACVAAIILAILATRPIATEGTFTREGVEKKQVNLMFFGNFYRMSYADYELGLNEMMKDKEYMQGSMIRDNYFLGKSIGDKYNYLRWSYNTFMYGLLIAVVLFLWVYLFPIWEVAP